MSPLVLPFPGIDPVAFSLGPFAVRWYGLAFAAGLILGWLYIRTLVADRPLWPSSGPPLSLDQVDAFVVWLITGVVVGGRLGQVLLYDPGYYAAHPAEIVQPWKGGMSFHGALAGSIIAILLFARRTAVAARTLMDLACTGIPIGVLLGRIANFINSEHWGHASDEPWAMVFPNGGDTPRHPSQLYEALLEGVALFVLLRIVTHRKLGLARPGLVAGLWLLGYAGARILCEVFREPETGHTLNIGPVTAGQIFSLPMIAFGAYLVRTAARSATVTGKTA